MGKGSKEKLTNLNWYPGHMKKTREMIRENLRLVDAVIEVADARIPISSRNPIIDELVKGKERVILLNKADLADDDQTSGWIDTFRKKGQYAVSVNSSTGTGINNLIRHLEKIQEKRDAEKARKRPLRLMVVGVPNAGKSSLINKLTGRKSAKTGDRPGVTRGKQWLTINNGMQLLDTPGILWPKFEDVNVGINLAFCGSIKDEILDIETLCLEFIKVLLRDYKELLAARYKVEELSNDGLEAMEQIAMKRGFIFPGKRIDYERTARTVLDEFRAGKIGRITLERCDSQAE